MTTINVNDLNDGQRALYDQLLLAAGVSPAQVEGQLITVTVEGANGVVTVQN